MSICTQPECPLRDAADPRALVAELALDRLFGEAPERAPSGPSLVRRAACRQCVEKVLAGRIPLPTRDELERSQAAGRRSRRRTRRRQRSERLDA